MKCPFCGYEESKVIDSRPTDDSEKIRRRRECLKCAKRFITYSSLSLSEREDCPEISVTHPGISFTGITSHYPKLIFAIIKHPMKWIFMSPRKAALCILKGLYAPTKGREWWGPRLFGVWGLPRLYQYTKMSQEEIQGILQAAEEICQKIK